MGVAAYKVGSKRRQRPFLNCNAIWARRGASAQIALVGTANSSALSNSTGRKHDPELLLVAPPPTPLKSQNIATHQKPRIRHVVNDVAMHVP